MFIQAKYIAPQSVLSSAVALGTERTVMNSLQSSFDTQAMNPYTQFQDDCFGQTHNKNVHHCVDD